MIHVELTLFQKIKKHKSLGKMYGLEFSVLDNGHEDQLYDSQPWLEPFVEPFFTVADKLGNKSIFSMKPLQIQSSLRNGHKVPLHGRKRSIGCYNLQLMCPL